MANAQENPNSSLNYGDYSQYSGYRSGSYDTTTSVTTATTPGYNYGYNYSEAGYSGYNSYNDQYGYNQNYDYNNYSGYYTTTTTTLTAQTPVSSGVGNPSERSHVSGNTSYGSSGSNMPAPPPPPAMTGSSSTAWGGYYNNAQSSNTSGYNQQQTGFSANQSASSGPTQNQSTSGSRLSWNQQGYENQTQTNVQDGAGTQQSYQNQIHKYGSQPHEGQYQSKYKKNSYNEYASDYDNCSNKASYYSGVQDTSNYDNEGKPFGDTHGGNNRGRDKFNNTESGVGDSYGSNDGGLYKNQYFDDKDPRDEIDARIYRDNSVNRNDRGRGRGFQGRGRGNQGSGFHGLKGQWSEDNGHDQNYGQRLNNDNRGGRGSFRGSGRGRGNVFSGNEMENNSNRKESDSGNRGWGRGSFGRGDNHERNRGGFRGGYESSRGFRGGNDHGSFNRGGGRGDRGGARGGSSKWGQESGSGRGRGSCTDSKESSSNVINVPDYKPWTNTTLPSAELKRKPEPVLTTAAKKKKEEEMVDVMPFIQTHIEEHCTVNEDARKLAEESLKKMMQPAYCVLCNARMSGAPQAKMHYQGKNHNKKIKNFITGGMTKYAEKVKEDANKTEEQLEKERLEEEERNRLLDQQVEEGARRVRENLLHLANQEASNIPNTEGHSSPAGMQTSGSLVVSQNPEFCHLCTIEFSSAQQAEQHYQGKNHKKRLKHIGPGAEELGQFVCELCNVRVTTQEILNQHLNGAKHKSKASREPDTKDYIVPEGGLVIEGGLRLKPGFSKGRGGNSNTGVDWPSKPRANIDYSNFRTPSGKYYCPMCDVTMNTEAHFGQHSQSRTHRQKNLDKKYQDLNEKS